MYICTMNSAVGVCVQTIHALQRCFLSKIPNSDLSSLKPKATLLHRVAWAAISLPGQLRNDKFTKIGEISVVFPARSSIACSTLCTRQPAMQLGRPQAVQTGEGGIPRPNPSVPPCPDCTWEERALTVPSLHFQKNSLFRLPSGFHNTIFELAYRSYVKEMEVPKN